MKDSFWLAVIFFGAFFGAWMLGTWILQGQTQIDATQQKGPVVVQFATCTGSGSGTIVNADGSITPYNWNCSGLSMFQFKLPNGTIAGPYIAVPILPPGTTGAVTWVNQLITMPPALGAKEKR